MERFNPHIKKISLIFPPSTSLLSWEPMVTPPIGIAYLAAVLRDAGFDLSCLDTVIEKPYQVTPESKHVGRYGLNYKEVMEWVEKERPDVVGISCVFSNQWPSVRELARMIKALDDNITVVTGGTHPTFLAQRCMQDAPVDFIVLGEGEYTFRDLVEHLKNERSCENIDGLVFRDNGGVRVNPKTTMIENLDELPFPARDLLPMEKYFKVALPMGYSYVSRRNTPIFTSRGCTCRCTFCSSTNYWKNRFRVHSPDYVLSEIDHLVNDFKVRELKFQDDNLTLNRKRAEKIFEGMIERDYRLTWNTPNGIAIWTLDEKMLRLMKKSGCFSLTMAIESGNQEVMDNLIKKPLKLEKVVEVNDIMRRLRIDRYAYFIIGLPGETRAQILDTVNFGRRLKLEAMVLFIYNPLPGSKLYETCIEKGYIKEDDFFEGGGNQYFSSVVNSEEWTAEELERIIRKEWFQNYWSFFRSPRLVGRRWLLFILNRPTILRFLFVRTIRALMLMLKGLFSPSDNHAADGTEIPVGPGGRAKPGGSAK